MAQLAGGAVCVPARQSVRQAACTLPSSSPARPSAPLPLGPPGDGASGPLSAGPPSGLARWAKSPALSHGGWKEPALGSRGRVHQSGSSWDSKTPQDGLSPASRCRELGDGPCAKRVPSSASWNSPPGGRCASHGLVQGSRHEAGRRVRPRDGVSAGARRRGLRGVCSACSVWLVRSPLAGSVSEQPGSQLLPAPPASSHLGNSGREGRPGVIHTHLAAANPLQGGWSCPALPRPHSMAKPGCLAAAQARAPAERPALPVERDWAAGGCEASWQRSKQPGGTGVSRAMLRSHVAKEPRSHKAQEANKENNPKRRPAAPLDRREEGSG